MLVEGLLLWSKVVAVNLSEDRHMKYYYLIGWGRAAWQNPNHFNLKLLLFPSGWRSLTGVPLFSPPHPLPVYPSSLFSSSSAFPSFFPGLPVLIVTITLASASGKYSADGHCWLSVQNGVIWGFAGPVIFIIMVSNRKCVIYPSLNYSSAKMQGFFSLMFVLFCTASRKVWLFWLYA